MMIIFSRFGLSFLALQNFISFYSRHVRSNNPFRSTLLSRSFDSIFDSLPFFEQRHVSCITTVYPYNLYNMGFLLIIS